MLAHAFDELAILSHSAGDNKEAERLFRQSLALWQGLRVDLPQRDERSDAGRLVFGGSKVYIFDGSTTTYCPSANS